VKAGKTRKNAIDTVRQDLKEIAHPGRTSPLHCGPAILHQFYLLDGRHNYDDKNYYYYDTTTKYSK